MGVAALQAHVHEANDRIAEQQEIMHAQLTAGTVDISRFEERIMQGCHQLCTHVHFLAGDQNDVRTGVVNLIATVK